MWQKIVVVDVGSDKDGMMPDEKSVSGWNGGLDGVRAETDGVMCFGCYAVCRNCWTRLRSLSGRIGMRWA